MIEQDVMDKLIKVRTEDEEMEELIGELQEAGFVVTNFSKGGIFYTLLRVCVHVGVQLKNLAADMINSAFLKHCPDEWVEIRAADYSKSRKQGLKAEGYLTITRDTGAGAFLIKKGHPFRTDNDAYGNYLRYYALEDTVLEAGQEMSKVLVQAEDIGIAYNAAPGRIVHTMVHIDGLIGVINADGWMTQDGTPVESIESLRDRCINGRSEYAERLIDRRLKSIVEAISGVKVAYINSQHPRGQGTCDVIVTGTGGAASEKLLAQVREAIEPLTGSIGDYLVKSSTTKKVDISVTVYLERGVSTDGCAAQVTDLITRMMDVTGREELHTFYRDRIIGCLIKDVNGYRRCDIHLPAEDITEAEDVVIVAGDIRVMVDHVK